MPATLAKNSSRRRAGSALALPATLLALAGATALIPATASAADDQGGTRASCYQIAPDIYIDLDTGAECKSTESSGGSAEVINVREPYCYAAPSRCLPNGGRAPQPRDSEKVLGEGPGRGRGSGAAPVKNAPPKPKPGADLEKCAQLMQKGNFKFENVSYDGILSRRDVLRMNLRYELSNLRFFLTTLPRVQVARRLEMIADALHEVWKINEEFPTLNSQGEKQPLTSAERKARKDFKDLKCRDFLWEIAERPH